MTTEKDLRDAYAHLSGVAPSREVLNLLRPEGVRRRSRRTGRLRLVAVAATVLLLALATPALVHRLRPDARTTPNGPVGTPTTAPFPTAYFFGPSSLGGYNLDVETLGPEGQMFEFTNIKTHAGIVLSTLPATAKNDSLYEAGDPVSIGARTGFFVGVWAPRNTLTVAWKLNATNWVTMTGNKPGSGKSLTRPQLLAVVPSVRAARDDRAALVVVGRLPAHMRFDGVNVYRNQGTMASPDLYTGTGYRSESFVDRRSEEGGSFDIVSVYHPFQSLTTATPKTLPSFDDGPWTRTTVRGHLAWTAPHDVLIQWGPIIIDLVSNRPTGNTSIALVSRTDLLAVANSLTVPASVAVGAGFPLSTSLPPGTID